MHPETKKLTQKNMPYLTLWLSVICLGMHCCTDACLPLWVVFL